MKKTSYWFVIILGIITLTIPLTNCNKEGEVRTFKEKNQPLQEQSPQQPIEIGFTWQTPEGWKAEGPSGLRLATLSIREEEGEAICTIIPLKQDGGGLKPNIVRWLAQLNLELNDDITLEQFIQNQRQFQTVAKLPATFIDFTPLAKNKTDVSMLITLIQLKEQTLFIKLKGKLAVLLSIKDSFYSFSKSFKEN